MKLLVCGGRHYGVVPYGNPSQQEIDKAYQERAMLERILDYVHETWGVTMQIDGAAKGADSLAHNWAVSRGIPWQQFPADWERDGRRAGGLRNFAMACERPDAAVAFPGGPGTRNMTDILKQGHVPLWEVRF
jgi:hypothetical protein